MALADRIAVMDQGRVVQIAAPATLYREPATNMVARFVAKAGSSWCASPGQRSGRVPISLLGYKAVARCHARKPASGAPLPAP